MASASALEPVLGRMDSLADPTRLRLLRLLERHELGVTDLMDVLQLPQSTVSRHLKLLADRGWVKNRAQGPTNFYRMRTDELPAEARRLWQVTREQIEGWATLQQDQVRLDRRLRGRKDGTQAFFAGAAGQWDKLRDEVYGRGFAQAAIRALLPGDWVVADLGCGTGAVAADLAPWVARVVGVDQSAAMLKAAGKRTARLGNVDLRQGDLESLPIEDAACDAALLLLTLSYAHEPERVVAEMARILKPGGRAVIVDLMRHDRDDFRVQMRQQNLGFEEDQLPALLAGAGLEGNVCHPLPPEPGATGPALLLAAGRRAPKAKTSSARK
jgi:ArsR family transcriptional regulator